LEPEEPVIALYWVLIGAARACPVAPETGEHKERLALIKCEPDPDLLANDGVRGIVGSQKEVAGATAVG
jgi:hypothetical protein